MERNLPETVLNDLAERLDESNIGSSKCLKNLRREYCKAVKEQYPYLRRYAVAYIVRKKFAN